MLNKVHIISCPDISKARLKLEHREVVNFDAEVPSKLKEAFKGKGYFIKTYGCQGNVRDEETMAGLLERLEMHRVEEPKEAAVAIINTCAVRENAESKIYGEIGKYKTVKATNKNLILGVSGCMMQEEDKASYLLEHYPQVDITFGTHNIHHLYDLLIEVLEKKNRVMDVMSFPGNIVEGMPVSRLLEHKAYVNISYGCDKFCTYCIVPYTRGRERSRPLDEIIKECQKLYDEGYQEVTLLGQNVNSYGKDLEGVNFATLLEEVAKTNIPRIRFLTSHPYDFSLDMLKTIAKHKNIMKWIHLPVQSGSSDILMKMGRRYDKEGYLKLVKDIREIIPDISLSTDIIVGFPNETEEDFNETLDVVNKVQYESAFTFIYSPRNGTPAARIKDDVSDETKHERFTKLTKAVETHVEAKAKEMVGHTYEVLVDGPSKRDDDILSGYTESNKLVNFKGPSYLKGCIVPVKVIESHTYSLIGELVGHPLVHKAKRVHDLLTRETVTREYLKTEEAIKNNESLQALLGQIEASKKELANSMGGLNYENNKLKFEKLQELLNNDPLIANREALKEELEGLLKQIEEILR